MLERAREQIRRLGPRGETLGDCPICGRRVRASQPRVKAWAGKFAHRSCASYSKRRSRGSSQVVHGRFTTT